MPEHAQSPTALQFDHPTNLLSLPDEILLEVIAHVPYSQGKSLIALKRVNRQLFGLLTDESSHSQLRRLIAKVQYSYCLAFGMAKDEPSFAELDRMDARTTIINRVFSWMEDLYPVVEDNNNPHNEAHLLHIGLHLFFAISKLRLDVASEYETALFLTKLGTPATALLRLTSTRVARCLQELAKQFGRELQQDVFSLPVIFSVIDTMLVRGGLYVIDEHLSSGTPGSP